MVDKREDWPISGINTTVTMLKMLDKDKIKLGSATGFFFIHNDKKYLVTNRHVVIDEDEDYYPAYLELRIHNSKIDYTSNHIIYVQLYTNSIPNWHEHLDYSTNHADIVVIPLDCTTFDSYNLNLFNGSIVNFLSEKNIPKDVKISSFANVIIVGYPLGFYDEANNLPVYRKGMIASSYPINFNQLPYFLIDANLHEGTSGSPVLNSSDNILLNEKGAFHSDYAYFLGIHSAEYTVDKEPLSLCVVWYPSIILEIIDTAVP